MPNGKPKERVLGCVEVEERREEGTESSQAAKQPSSGEWSCLSRLKKQKETGGGMGAVKDGQKFTHFGAGRNGVYSPGFGLSRQAASFSLSLQSVRVVKNHSGSRAEQYKSAISLRSDPEDD